MGMLTAELDVLDGVEVARIRIASGLTQRELAGMVRMSVSGINKIEQNKRRNSDIATVAALARALAVPIEELLKRSSPE